MSTRTKGRGYVSLICLLFEGVALIASGLLGVGVSAADQPGKSVVPAFKAAAPSLHGPNSVRAPLLRLPRRPPATPPMRAPSMALRAAPARLPASANLAAIEPLACPDGALAWSIPVLCGYVPVPLDWSHPGSSARIRIYFELYTPPRSTPAESAILNNYGGPGSATTTSRWIAFYFFGQNLDKQDLLLIDDRGRGLSSTIDCPDLQHGTAPFAQAEAECAAQLGMAASRYGTGEIAQDTDAVRAALGYDKVDYFGWSYGGADVEAYATRFGEHLRSIVLDAPVGTPALDQFDFDRARTQSEPRMVRLDCLRSPTCAPDHPFPNAELAALAATVRFRPVEGDSHDASGNPRHIRIDEAALLPYLIDNPTGKFVSTGELLAAATALWRNDPAPLLRLGAEGYFPVEADYGDPTGYSNGAFEATWSADFKFPWDWSASVPTRQEQYDDAIRALPRWFFYPFSKRAVANNLLFEMAVAELWWEMPTPPVPLVPRHPRYPHVPTLVLSGDMDRRVPLEITTKVAALYPDSVFVRVAEAGHVVLTHSQCGANLASEFIRNLQVVDTSCANKPETVWPAVGRFPLRARDARPAAIDTMGVNEIGLSERKVATVAVAAATDAMKRATIGWGTGVGLRGGTFSTDYGDSTTWTGTLQDCAFAKDVQVSGIVTWSPGSPAVLGNLGDSSFSADLTVAGAGTAGGALHVEGKWQAQGPVGKFRVTGTLGGRAVAVLVPEA